MENIFLQLDALISESPAEPLLARFETVTSINRVHLLVASVLLLLVIILVGPAASVVCNTIGVLYPVYLSVDAVESFNWERTRNWLIFWIIFAVIYQTEYLFGIFISLIPFYWAVKLAFITWLMLPNCFSGSFLLYEYVVKPLLKRPLRTRMSM